MPARFRHLITLTCVASLVGSVCAVHPATRAVAAGSPALVSVTLSPSTIPADLSSTSTARAVVTDANRMPVAGQPVVFTTDGDVTFSTGGAGLTGADGSYMATITASTTPGAETITATAGTVRGSATLLEGPGWVQDIPPVSPPQRTLERMAYDPISKQVLLFGGVNALVSQEQNSGFQFFAVSTYGLNDMWAWNGLTWVPEGSTTPPPTGGVALAMADDENNHTMVVLFGKRSDNEPDATFSTETWIWDAVVRSWTQAPVVSPPFRYGSAMAYDPVSGDVVLFGGGLMGSEFGDTWIWDGTAWSQPSVTPSPSAREAPSLAFDAVGRRLILFGGLSATDNGSVFPDDTWAWDGAARDWVQLAPAHSPSGRAYPAMAADLATSTIVLFGGRTVDGDLDDTWLWNGTDWAPPVEPVTTSSPPADALSAAMAYDVANQTLVLFDGVQPVASVGPESTNFVAPNETWTFLDASAVTVSLAPGSIPADGVSTATVTAVVTDAGGRPSPGESVRLATDGDVSLGPVIDRGDGSYAATITASTTPGLETITAAISREAVAGSAGLSERPVGNAQRR